MATAAIDFGGRAMTVAALHLYWPWPFEQPRQVADLAGVLSRLPDETILAGDFNAVRWGESLARIVEAGRLRDAGPVFDQIGTLRAVSAQVALTVEAPLDDTRHRSERDRAELAVTVARQRLDAVLQQVASELDEAQQRDTSARRRIDLADRTLEIARKQLEAEQARFRTGSATALQVREAEDQVRTAELRTARARVDLAVAHLAIAHLTGDLLRETARAR